MDAKERDELLTSLYYSARVKSKSDWLLIANAELPSDAQAPLTDEKLTSLFDFHADSIMRGEHFMSAHGARAYARAIVAAAPVAPAAAEKKMVTACCGRSECGGECGNEWRGMVPAQPDERAAISDDQWIDLATRHANSDWHSADSDGYLNAVKALCADYAASGVRPTDDALWDQTLRERDSYHDWADKLADSIALHLGIDIGEHSNANNPWNQALDAIMATPSVAELSAPKAKSECAARKQGSAGGNDPAECDWPMCGCDPKATEVIAALQECDLLKSRNTTGPIYQIGANAGGSIAWWDVPKERYDSEKKAGYMKIGIVYREES